MDKKNGCHLSVHHYNIMYLHTRECHPDLARCPVIFGINPEAKYDEIPWRDWALMFGDATHPLGTSTFPSGLR